MTVVPPPAGHSKRMPPPNFSTMRAERGRPRPVPRPGAFVVKKGSNTRAWIEGGMPGPASSTSSTRCGAVRPGADVDGVLAAGGVVRVAQQVGQHLVQARAGPGRRAIRGSMSHTMRGASPPERHGHRRDRLLDEALERLRRLLDRRVAREGQQALDDVGHALHARLGEIEVLAGLRVAVHAVLGEPDAAQRGVERVVQLVGDAGRELADHRELLLDAEALAQVLVATGGPGGAPAPCRRSRRSPRRGTAWSARRTRRAA